MTQAQTPRAAAGATDAEAAEGHVYTVSGEDWDEIVAAANEARDFQTGERLVINMGPQHPSTHGVLRLVLTLEGETVVEVRPAIGYLHTGIEKNMEFRTWTQGVTFCTRADYLMPLFNEMAYCLAVERLLGIEDKIPERAQIIRVLMLELNRITSHLGGIAPMGLELGATTIYTQGARLRERGLDLLELITGLRMNHAFIRPGGVAQDLPPGALEAIGAFLDTAPELVQDLRTLIDANPIFIGRNKGIAYLDLAGCMALGVTGPDAAGHRAALGPAQVPAVLRVRDLRLRRAHGGHLRCVRPVPDQDGRGRAVDADRPAVRRPAGRPRFAGARQGSGDDQGR
jgi:NADH-quinone oxidoreductase subunit D